MVKKVKIYDLECLINFFSYAAIDRDSDKISIYYISPVNKKWREQLLLLYDELENKVSGLIGFNNLNYDYPLIHHLLENKSIYLKMDSAEDVVNSLYAKSQDIIKSEHSAIWNNLVKIPQLDLYRIWHYDNSARATGLKVLQISMNYPNVQDMPFKHYDYINNIDDVNKILEYNINDILSTKLFYEKSIDKIKLRKKLNEKYNIQCINWSDSKIGEELILKLYCDATNNDPKVIRKLRTYRNILHFNECIPKYVKFNSNQFKDLVKYLESIHVEKLKKSFSYSVIYKGFKYDLGTGGINMCPPYK